MTVLITGLAHPIGHYLLDLACAQGLEVRALAGNDFDVAPYHGRAELIRGEIDDDAALAAAVRDVDIVYHTAFLAWGSPEQLHRANSDGTRRVLEACGGDVRRFVFVGTPSVYTLHDAESTWPVVVDARREAHGTPLLLAIGQSMIEAEDYLFEAHERYGMEYCLLRVATTWGRNPYPTNIVKGLMSAPQQVEKTSQAVGPIQWIHGVDAARAALLAGSHEAARNEAFIVAGAQSITCRDLISEIWDITRPTEPNPYAAQATARRPSRTKLDITKVRDRLGFEPRIPFRHSLEEILGRRNISPTANGESTPTSAVQSAVPAVPAGTTMAGKTCVITGATSGIGLATAERLAGIGARLVLVGRDPARGERALKQIRAKVPEVDAIMLYADLSRLSEVRRLAAEILEAAPRIDVLLNNAGKIFDSPEITEDGLERTFVVNYLSHFLLTVLLLDRVKTSAPARIVTVASGAHHGVSVDFDDIQNLDVAHGYAAYQRAKLFCILFTRELAARLSGTGVAACSAAPGVVATRIGDGLTGALGRVISQAMETRSMTPAAAAESMAYLASSPDTADANGKYFDQGRLTTPAPTADDAVTAKRLWVESERLAKPPA